MMSSYKPVKFATFSRWNTGGHIRTEVNQEGYVDSVYCKLCAKHANVIIKTSKVKGRAKEDIQRYICGTRYVTKYTVLRHLESSSHKLAIEHEKLETDVVGAILRDDGSEPVTGSGSNRNDSNVNEPKLKQPKINSSFLNVSREAYRKLFNTAYVLATDNIPLNQFQTLVKIQKTNGIPLISKCDSGNKAKEFIEYISLAVRQKIRCTVNESNFFTLLTDGSQARKTGSEKELVFIRIIKSGVPTFLCVALKNVDDYGDANADNLKTSIDSVFQKEIDTDELDYLKKLICFTSDGASVNTGKKHGLVKQMRDCGRDWLIAIHCILHRVELAVKDSILKYFQDVYDFLVLLYYQCKRSSKLPRHLKELGKVYSVRTYKFKKVHGTRFVSHHRKGIETLLQNWILLGMVIEDQVRTEKDKPSLSKLNGILKKLKDFNFLCVTIIYLNLLTSLSTLSLYMERSQILVTDIMPAIYKTVGDLEDLKAGNNAEEVAESKGFNIKSSPSSLVPGTLEYTLSRDHTSKDKSTTVSLDLRFIKNVDKASAEIKARKDAAIPILVNCLEKRFHTFEDENIYNHMRWIDPANWVDIDSEIHALNMCADHFEIPLSHRNFNKTRIKSEWKDLRRVVKNYYEGVKALLLWEKLITYRQSEFRNVIMLAEIVLCLGPSNAVVESGFSFLSMMLTDRRLGLHHNTMENILLIKINDLIWNEREKNEIIEAATEMFLKKRRKMVTESTTSHVISHKEPDNDVPVNVTDSDDPHDTDSDEEITCEEDIEIDNLFESIMRE